MRLLTLLASAAVLAACGGQPSGAQTPPAAAGGPMETRPANAPYQPAFPGQTRAPRKSAGVAFNVVMVADGLDKPWGLAFLPDGRMLVTEKGGTLRIVAADGKLSAPVSGLPKVDARGQGGLLDVAVHDDWVYVSFSEPREGGNGTAVARGKLAGEALTEVAVIWRMTPTFDNNMHFGSRLAFSPDGFLFITTGERSDLAGRMQAQKLDAAFGKVIRIFPDGVIPKENPFTSVPRALPQIWSYGHRNIQSAAFNPATGQLWTVEHGPRGGDEVNIPKAGKDYGWPTIGYGLEYSGKPVGEGITQKAGMEQPVYYWDPVIAPSGMAFYDGALFPAWRGSLFIGGMKDRDLVRLTLDGDRVVGEERLLTDLKQRIRDVRVGPDGAVYVLTDGGGLLKLVPKG
ncbi:MAG: glucose sorbosone dehydrogenase [Caulobacter sp.]|jgi:glucose/arabinose dehydrogenase|nr:glucose sorbosone dehydrogenase [Caulobacter sp.]